MKYFTINLPKATAILLLALALAACGSNSAATPAPALANNSNDGSSNPTDSTTAAVKLNLNTASADDFLTIPGVGNRMVREFMEYRPYGNIKQFRREIGKYVDAAQVAEYEKYVFVPVDVNQADADTLKQIPGVDDAIAAELIAGRPYDSSDDFLAKLAAHVSEADRAVAENYLSTP